MYTSLLKLAVKAQVLRLFLLVDRDYLYNLAMHPLDSVGIEVDTYSKQLG